MNPSNNYQVMAVEAIRALFDQYVAPSYPNKLLNDNKVEDESGTNNSIIAIVWGYPIEGGDYIKAHYKHDGVYIFYYRRLTTKLGDTDMFSDYTVRVNNKTLVDRILVDS